MIVQKPQFDTDKIKPGQAYWLKENTGYRYNINAPCIIQAVKPLTIVVNYWSDKDKRMDQLTIDINAIVKESYSLEEMRVIKND